MDKKHELVFKAIGQLQVLSHLFIKKRSELAKRVGLTEAQWRVMEEINNQDFMPSLFAAKNEYSKAAISKVLRQLLDNGYVDVCNGEMDGRHKAYLLSENGTQLLGALNALRMKAIEQVWMSIDQELFESATTFNAQLIGNLKAFRG